MYSIEFTYRAEAQLDACVAWLRTHGADHVLHDELARAFAVLRVMPRAGVPVVLAPAPPLRRLLLRRSRLHLYYSLEEARRVVLLRAVWHTARGEPPPL